jgi:hypothetical protein
MCKASLAVLFILGVTAPALAESPRPLPEPSQVQGPTTVRPGGWVIQPGQWVAITAGVIAGAAAMEVLVPTRLLYIMGGVAGGYLANTWYDGRRVEIHTIP